MSDDVIKPIGYGSGHDKYDVMAAVSHALSGRPYDFENTTKSILALKMQDAIDGKREEVAASLFGRPESQEVEVDETPEVETEVSDNNEVEEQVEEETPTEE